MHMRARAMQHIQHGEDPWCSCCEGATIEIGNYSEAERRIQSRWLSHTYPQRTSGSAYVGKVMQHSHIAMQGSAIN